MRTLLAEVDEEEEEGQLESVLAGHGLYLHERFRREKQPSTQGL